MEEEICVGFDLLGLFDGILLPSAVLDHLDLNTKKLLRVCCKRLRTEVDATVTSLLVNRYNIGKLASGAPGALARRYPRLRRLALGANEARDVTSLLQSQLPALRPSLDCLDFWSYYSSVSAELWRALVELAPPVVTLRLNLNESLLRRMEVEQVLEALAALRRDRPGLVVQFNTAHSFFGLRSTDAATLTFLAAAPYITSLGFSIGLRGRELQNERFFEHLTGTLEHDAVPPAPEVPAAAAGGAAGSITALSLTHYEAAERPPVSPLLRGLHLLRGLRSLTLDCEISLQELAPLAACPGLTALTVDLLVVRPQVVAPPALVPAPAEWVAGYSVLGHPVTALVPKIAGFGRQGEGAGGMYGSHTVPVPERPPPVVTTPLPAVRSLTLGSESHPAEPLMMAFPYLTELTSQRSTRTVGVHNVFHCGLMLSGAASLVSLTLRWTLAAEAPAALAGAPALTSLAFVHTDNVSTAGLLRAAAALPSLRRLAVWDHEEADEYLAVRDLLAPPPAAAATATTESPPGVSAPPSTLSTLVESGPNSPTASTAAAPPLVFRTLRRFDLLATSPDFFEEMLGLLRGAVIQFGTELTEARLDACYDPPLLEAGRLGELLGAMGPGLRRVVVSGWATPGKEAAILSLGSLVGGPGGRLVVEYEYPIL